MNPFISLVSGLVAAFTPCVIVLFPIVLYRFFSEDVKDYKKYVLFSTGFISSFLVIAMILGTAFTSSLQNGFRVGFGLILLAIGILSVMGKLNPLNFPLIKNTFLLGTLFALVVAINPCSIPYLAVIISLEATGAVFLNILMFGLGMLIPSLLFALLGQSIVAFSNKGITGKIFDAVNRSMSYILILAGLYMLFTVAAFAYLDVYLVSLFMIAIFFFLMRSLLYVIKPSDLLKTGNLILIISSLFVIGGVIFQCYSFIDDSTMGEPPSLSTLLRRAGNTDVMCGGSNFLDCNTCMRCISLFSVSLVLFFIGLVINNRHYALKNRKVNSRPKKAVKKKDSKK